MGTFKSAFAAIYKTFRKALVDGGLKVGGTTQYPRVELHSFVENTPLDKGNSIRLLTLTVESLSSNSIAEGVQMIEDSLDELVSSSLNVEEGQFNIIAVVPEQLQEMTESIDSQSILYRILQTLNVYVELNNN